jgi:hypothetical protein
VSTVGLFQPSRADGRADWRVVFDFVEGMEPGVEVKHEALLDALETTDRQRLYRAVGRANRELWATRSRSLGAVKGVGYRMLYANEMPTLSEAYRKQGRRKVSNAVAVIDATDLGALDKGDREWVVKVQSGMHMLAAAMDSQIAKTKRHEELIEGLTRRVEELESH